MKERGIHCIVVAPDRVPLTLSRIGAREVLTG